MTALDSRVPGAHKLTPVARADLVAEGVGLSADERALLVAAMDPSDKAHPGGVFDRMVENCIGSIGMPFGVAMNFHIDGVDRFVPMAVEEPSVIAAASNAAKIARGAYGFKTECVEDLMIGQVMLLGIDDISDAARAVEDNKHAILETAEPEESSLGALGGGVKDLEVRILHPDAKDNEDIPPSLRGGTGEDILVVHLLVDTKDAMGANAVNARAERAAPLLEKLTGGTARLRILSNLADRRLVRAKAVFPADALGPEGTVDAILEAAWLARVDPYRAATHNKGVMNGVDAVVVATGNDWRAVEAAAHAYAARDGRYRALTRYTKTEAGDLRVQLRLPIPVGTVGGATKVNPMARLALRILQTDHAEDLARVACAVGLAQNLAAVRALATEGIQKGHMRLHRRMEGRA